MDEDSLAKKLAALKTHESTIDFGIDNIDGMIEASKMKIAS